MRVLLPDTRECVGRMARMPDALPASTRTHPGEDWIEQAHVDLAGLWEGATFRVIEAYDVVVGPRWVIDLEVQPYAEVWWIREGACALRLGAKEAIARAGEVAVLMPGPKRSSANGGAVPLSLSGFGCSLVLFDGVDLLAQLDVPLVVSNPSVELTSAIERVVRASRGAPPDRIFRTRAWAELALAEVVAQAPLAAADLAARSRLESLRPEVSAALEWIAGHHGDPSLDLRTLAAAVHLSPQHLTRCFRESLGVAPMGYLRRHRLSRARDRLIESDRPVSAIMLEVGLTNLAHFSRAFKNQFGSSPRAFRAIERALRADR
jgi:AraC-like DNA-binding protein